MEITGTLEAIFDTEQVSQKFEKRSFVVKTNEQYPQVLIMEFVQDKTSILDQYEVGEEVKVGINLRGREWTTRDGETKYYNTIQAWRIDRLDGSRPVKKTAPQPAQYDEQEDDLPF